MECLHLPIRKASLSASCGRSQPPHLPTGVETPLFEKKIGAMRGQLLKPLLPNTGQQQGSRSLPLHNVLGVRERVRTDDDINSYRCGQKKIPISIWWSIFFFFRLMEDSHATWVPIVDANGLILHGVGTNVRVEG